MSIQKIDFKAGWKDIEPVILKLHSMLEQKYNPKPTDEKLQITKVEYSNTYTLIYNMCMDKEHNNSGQLYEAYRKQMQLFVKEKIFSVIKGLKGEELLNKLIQKWDIYQIFIRFMTRFFSYLDKSYIENGNLSKLKYLGYYIYLKQVHENLKDNIILAFQDEIQKDRENFKCDLDVLRKISEIFVEINRNESQDANETYLHLGKAITKHARQYYQQKFQEWSEQCSCEEYIQNIINVQAEETIRFEKCLTKFTDTPKQITAIFNDEMILKYKPILLHKEHGFLSMLKNNKTQVLGQVFFLFRNLNDNFQDIRQAFSEWVRSNGTDIFEEKIKSLAEDNQETKKKKKFATV